MSLRALKATRRPRSLCSLLIGLLRGAVLGTCAWIAGIIVFAIGLSIIFSRLIKIRRWMVMMAVAGTAAGALLGRVLLTRGADAVGHMLGHLLGVIGTLFVYRVRSGTL